MSGPVAFATCHGPPERVADFHRVFGTDTVPVTALAPHWGNLPGLGRTLVYEIDVAWLTSRQREGLIGFGADRFGMSVEEAERELDAHGFPILADDCTVITRRLDLIL